MRQMLRTSNAVRFEIDVPQFGMSPENQFQRVSEIDVEIEVTNFAAGVALDRVQRVLDVRGHAARRAEDVPVDGQQTAICRVEAGFDCAFLIGAESSCENERANSGQLL